MKSIWKILYNLFFLPLLYTLLKFASVFNKKIRKGVRGRKRLFEDLILNINNIDRNKELIWFHSSSLGEFEQAKPIIEKVKKDTGYNVLVSFFSPSGYDNSRRYPFADIITYIPFDSSERAEKFVKIVQPSLVVFMRYDIWPNHIWALEKNKIPCFLVDATMKSNSARKLPFIKSFHRFLFKGFKKILTISESDAKGFKQFGCTDQQVITVGDTRFDRVYQKSILSKQRKLINENVLINKKVLIAGSTWEQDEEVIFPAIKKLIKYDESIIYIIAPHEPTLLHLEKIEHEFTGTASTIRFSHLNNYSDEKIIIVDSIGILLTLYTYADAAFIGGSFKQNVHNVLEAAVYGIPVLFGPKIENSQEAIELRERGGALMIRGKREAYRRLRTLFTDEELRKKRGKISYDYVQENIGATEKIITQITSAL